MSVRPLELGLETSRGRFAGLHWRRPNAAHVLCLHGWLDNAASFVPLGAHLPSWNVVALDLAGHGRSQHRPRGYNYYFADYLWDIDAVLDALGWDACHLVGHSLGGGLACVFGAAAPERVVSIALLDAVGPLSGTPEMTVERLRESLQSVRRGAARQREFRSRDTAVELRRSRSDLTEAAARLLCDRALERFEDRYRWRTDPGLKWRSPTLMSEEQVLAILSAIDSPVLAITVPGLTRWFSPAMLKRRLGALRDCRHHEIQGHHHFHMERPAEVAPLLRDFLVETETGDVSTQS